MRKAWLALRVGWTAMRRAYRHVVTPGLPARIGGYSRYRVIVERGRGPVLAMEGEDGVAAAVLCEEERASGRHVQLWDGEELKGEWGRR